ncbi:MAG TPA: hypothetical protein VFF73_23680, partial [Planctomycetota bacterium]|nr:hypothetical protein [Planctomycetota bacterium]
VFGAAFFMRVRDALTRGRASLAPTGASLVHADANDTSSRASSTPPLADLDRPRASSATVEAESAPTAA